MFYIRMTRKGQKPHSVCYANEEDAIAAYNLVKQTPDYNVEIIGRNQGNPEQPPKTLGRSTVKGRKRHILTMKR